MFKEEVLNRLLVGYLYVMHARILFSFFYALLFRLILAVDEQLGLGGLEACLDYLCHSSQNSLLSY